MSLDTLFQIASITAMVGWVVLLISPWAPHFADRVGGIAIPLLLSIGYSVGVVAFWGLSEGGFDTLDNVVQLFSAREVVLVGWVHYLAFDLFVGAWQVRVARRDALPFLLVVPCLALTFLAGPLGLALFLALRFGMRRKLFLEATS